VSPEPISAPKSPARFGRLRRLGIIVVTTYACVCMVVGFLQAKLIYFPSRGYPHTPADVGLAFERLKLTAADGAQLAAWFVPAPAASHTILFCHGNAGNISDRLDGVKRLQRLGYSVLIFDYRGYGDSGGSPTEEGTYLDADAAWRHLTDERGVPPESIILFGESLGGAVAIHQAAREAPGALVVESTFTSLVDVARVHYPFLPVGLLLRHRYPSIDLVGRIRCPKLFIHAREDELIPMHNARRLFDAALSPKEFLETPGGHNTGGFQFDTETTRALGDFLRRALRT